MTSAQARRRAVVTALIAGAVLVAVGFLLDLQGVHVANPLVVGVAAAAVVLVVQLVVRRGG